MPSGLTCRSGLAPWGYRREGGRLVEVPAEFAIADRACELRRSGLGIRAIGRTLAAEGARGRGGNPISLRTVALIVVRAGVHETHAQQPAKPLRIGRWTGGRPPWGFKVAPEGGLVPDEQEREIVDVVLELRHVSGCSYRQIADQLFLEGYRSRAGKRITVQRVARMVWTHATERGQISPAANAVAKRA